MARSVHRALTVNHADHETQTGLTAQNSVLSSEEQINREQMADMLYQDANNESFAEATTYFPSTETLVLGPEEYLNHLRRVKEAVNIPVIASLNGSTPGGWLSYGHMM